VADTDNHRIAVFNHEGCYLKNIGCKGTKLNEFDQPFALALSHTVLGVLEKGKIKVNRSMPPIVVCTQKYLVV
jgi:hypothetical protein